MLFSFKSKDWNVAPYVINSSPQLQHAMQILNQDDWFANFAKQFNNTTPTIADFGCGDGKITAFLAQQFPQFNFIGIDYSSTMIDHANYHYGKASYPNLSFICQDISDKQFPNVIQPKVDGILSFSAIHWVKNQKQLQENIQAISKPSTQFCIMFYSKDNYLWESIQKTALRAPWKKYFPHYETPYYGDTDELKAFFKQQGISPRYDIVLQQYKKDGRFHLKNYLLGITPIYAPIQKALENEKVSEQAILQTINAFLDEVIQQITQIKNSTFVENKDGSSAFYYQRGLFKSVLKPRNNMSTEIVSSQRSCLPSKL